MLSTFLLMLTRAAALYGASTQVFSSKKAEIMPFLLYHWDTVSLHGANHAIQWCAHNRSTCWYNCLCLAHYCLALTSFSTVFILVMSIWDIWALGKTLDLSMTSCCTILGSSHFTKAHGYLNVLYCFQHCLDLPNSQQYFFRLFVVSIYTYIQMYWIYFERGYLVVASK